MPWPLRPRCLGPLAVASLAAVALGGCASTTSSGSIEIADRETPSARNGALLFNKRCSGCHTLDAAGAQGSKPLGQLSGGERTNGPNFSIRREEREDVLYAVRNGGFSGAIMPANIVVGRDAQDVAEFLAKYSGGGQPATGGPGRRDAGSGSTGN